jgi:hypothetical protein
MSESSGHFSDKVALLSDDGGNVSVDDVWAS